MKAFISALLASAAVSIETLTVDNGYATIQITEDGVPKTLYVATGSSQSHDNTMVIPQNGRAVLIESPSMDPSQFYKPNLLGGSVEYDVDLSESNCGCIAAFYLISAPGKDSNGNYWNTDGYYYCDANQVAGNFCPEWDIMEANQWATQTTPHSCDSPTNKGFYTNCNRGGDCWLNNVNMLDYSDYGPGSNFKIDTTREWHFAINWKADGSFSTTMSQDGNNVSMYGDCGSKITGDLQNGMAFAISNWSTYDSWLWKDRCQASTCNASQLLFKNISIKTGSDTPVPPTPSNYVYGNACATSWDDDCNGCDCRWSWPSNEDWSGPDAHCRCYQ